MNAILARRVEDQELAHQSSQLYVQYGCGLDAPEGWINFDNSPRLRAERMPVVSFAIARSIGLLFPPNARPGDIVRGLPVPDATARAVYCSHVLEHLARDDLPAALRNTLQMLMPGGVFRLVVPDLAWRVAEYAEAAARQDHRAVDSFLDSCLLGLRSRPRTAMERLRSAFGNSFHLWMYDFAAFHSLLEEAGFVKIRRTGCGDAEDPMFRLVEQRDRYFDGDRPELAIEAIRPV